MYKNNREDHRLIFDKLEEINSTANENNTILKNHLQHHEKRERETFALLLIIPSVLLSIFIIILRIAGAF